ncbi:TMEM165/GDT1 family protein [Sphingomonas sp. G-3-2-10]|uniref:TMEM165/GDT1 family protein n=1 Tax=Sphingomonas sp. G-3-2-10 TaxID=2728838 RepID=UPI00146F8C75|nr:TMEM165/GDT1 family protein [Sphingomonas sp. G-3-2-10]NML07591.1 TMEM165/GDT1 family protein [Sphingomonas sp. G-3-2-10]
MEAFLTSLGLVSLAEIGDKTQLLAVVLALRFRKPWPIIAGIFVATVANHFLAALLGTVAADFLSSNWFRIAIGVSFVAMGLWTLVPDTFDEDEAKPSRFGPFLATTIAFFLVEMGDKTQIATVALGARFDDVVAVTMGTTLGMMVANAPVVLLGDKLLGRLNFDLVRKISAGLFIVIGVWTLWELFA